MNWMCRRASPVLNRSAGSIERSKTLAGIHASRARLGLALIREAATTHEEIHGALHLCFYREMKCALPIRSALRRTTSLHSVD